MKRFFKNRGEPFGARFFSKGSFLACNWLLPKHLHLLFTGFHSLNSFIMSAGGSPASIRLFI